VPKSCIGRGSAFALVTSVGAGCGTGIKRVMVQTSSRRQSTAKRAVTTYNDNERARHETGERNETGDHHNENGPNMRRRPAR